MTKHNLLKNLLKTTIIFLTVVFLIPKIALAAEHYYLYPPVLHMVNGETSAPIIITDGNGNPVAGSINFISYNSSVMRVNNNSTDKVTITALQSETREGMGYSLSASVVVGGENYPLRQQLVVRILGNPLSFYTSAVGYQMVWKTHTAVYYPNSSINGQNNIQNYVVRDNLPNVLEWAYQIQSDITQAQTWDGEKQIYVVDFGEVLAPGEVAAGEGAPYPNDDNRRGSHVCGLSGMNPVRFGWNIRYNGWKNCFACEYGSHWSVYFHELGHNFMAHGVSVTMPSLKLVRQLSSYSEGLATYIGMQTSKKIMDNPATYPMDASPRNLLVNTYNNDKTNFKNDFNNWVAGGASISTTTTDSGSFNPNVVDGLLLTKEGERADFPDRFFKLLQPQYADQTNNLISSFGSTKERWHMLFAALTSAARGTDLYNEFRDTYHFPMDQYSTDYNNLYNNFKNILFAPPPMPIVTAI